MDTAQLAIVEHLAKNHLVRTKELYSYLLSKHFKELDVTEALTALEKTGHISRITPMGDENLALTKTGLRAAAGQHTR